MDFFAIRLDLTIDVVRAGPLPPDLPERLLIASSSTGSSLRRDLRTQPIDNHVVALDLAGAAGIAAGCPLVTRLAEAWPPSMSLATRYSSAGGHRAMKPLTMGMIGPMALLPRHPDGGSEASRGDSPSGGAAQARPGGGELGRIRSAALKKRRAWSSSWPSVGWSAGSTPRSFFSSSRWWPLR